MKIIIFIPSVLTVNALVLRYLRLLIIRVLLYRSKCMIHVLNVLNIDYILLYEYYYIIGIIINLKVINNLITTPCFACIFKEQTIL